MPVWDAEVTIDEALVRALLAGQFPELDASSARLLGEGWDNSVWVVGDEWAFRFPRREIAIPGVERELVVLPRLAPMLSVPIPVPTFIGRPSGAYPWPFFGARLLPGRELAEAELGEGDRVGLGAALGRFLRALHAREMRAVVEPEDGLPVDFNRRADMGFRVPRTRKLLEELGHPSSREVVAFLADAEALVPSSHEVLVHGDLHLRHVLVDRGAITGVIDWGDVCVGDPAIDLQLGWSLLLPGRRQLFFDEYGPIDRETELRARVLAVYLCAMLALYARHEAHARLERECLAGLQRALAE